LEFENLGAEHAFLRDLLAQGDLVVLLTLLALVLWLHLVLAGNIKLILE
jgi:hypothetical protein